MYRTAIVLEGGGLRGVFSAGVVDCLMDNDIRLDCAIGVSAGACNTFAYVAGHKKYFKQCIKQSKNPMDSFYGIPQMIGSHRLVDLDKIFYDYTERYGFDFEDFMNSPMKWEMAATNLETGKADYLTTGDPDRARLIGKASCSLPIITSPVEIDGKLYLDGGVADSIPIQRALDLGYERVLVVLTRKKGNFSSVNDATKMIISRLYADYPNFIKAAENRGAVYRQQVALCEKLEEEGKVIIIRPTMQEVNRLESDEDELMLSYYHGYTKTKEYISRLKEWSDKEVKNDR